MKITDPRAFGRVAVVMGGQSAEREVSLRSGAGVLDALRASGIDAHPVDGIPALLDALRAGHFARVFNILHGRGGEDGVLQGALDALGVPYTGSGVLGSALGMDKIRTKQVWQTLALPTPKYAVIDALHPRTAQAIVDELGLPLIVKPSHEGSTVGIARAFALDQLEAGIVAARQHDGDVLIEQFIVGDEFTVSIVDRQVLPSIRIVPAKGFYDYAAKYVTGDTQYLCPGADGESEAEMQRLALIAFDAIGCSGWGRIDFMRDRDGRLFLLEVNTAPGMTERSLVPKAAAQVGIDYPALCWRILESSFAEGSA
ncbi:MAG: D-alanine--D-alanine ligase [Rhodanobacteraceae bacterium]|nr:D-alanine--D-alanine ligase [Rhodanobacteraceae bacterium]MBK7044631.1 D-alanine--D-alanine ligase [Rhodanobacteraceae bacterium]MBP9153316.1 D-alanine--D-alanine ligase [Xanthomonadales bacterium]HQW82201.1 D-alanine--D-alanine ligase [Pseudomonadota bacterium]